MNTLRGNKCFFVNCSKNKRNDPNINLYRFPKDYGSRGWVVDSDKISSI